MQRLHYNRPPRGSYTENSAIDGQNTTDESSDEDDVFVLDDASTVKDRCEGQ